MKYPSFLLVGALVLVMCAVTRCDVDQEIRDMSDKVKKNIEDIGNAMDKTGKDLIAIGEQTDNELDRLIEEAEKSLPDEDPSNSGTSNGLNSMTTLLAVAALAYFL